MYLVFGKGCQVSLVTEQEKTAVSCVFPESTTCYLLWKYYISHVLAGAWSSLSLTRLVVGAWELPPALSLVPTLLLVFTLSFLSLCCAHTVPLAHVPQ